MISKQAYSIPGYRKNITIHELARRANTALGEVGCGIDQLTVEDRMFRVRDSLIDKRLIYKAFVLADPLTDHCCYDCWLKGYVIRLRCIEGDCSSV